MIPFLGSVLKFFEQVLRQNSCKTLLPRSHALAWVVRSDASWIMWQDRQGYLLFYLVKDLGFPLTSHDNCHCQPEPCSPTYVLINDKKNIPDFKEILHSPAKAPHYPCPQQGPGQGTQSSCHRKCCSCRVLWARHLKLHVTDKFQSKFLSALHQGYATRMHSRGWIAGEGCF